MASVLFVCWGNVFRSLAAELALKQELNPSLNIEVSSAGIYAKREKTLRADVVESLRAHGLDPSNHYPTRLTAAHLADATLVIAMGSEVQQLLRERFNYEAPLFNLVCHGRDEPVLDLIDAMPEYRMAPAAAAAYVRSAIDHIVASSKKLAADLPRLLTPKLDPGTQFGIDRTGERPLTP